MIAGELEGALNYNYDNFLSLKNKGAADNPKMNFFKKAGNAAGKLINNAGGVEGIGRTVDNVRSLFKKKEPSAPQGDFQFGLRQGDTSNQTNFQEEQKKEKEKKEKEKLIITGVVVVTGMVVIGGLLWYFKQKQQVVQLPR